MGQRRRCADRLVRLGFATRDRRRSLARSATDAEPERPAVGVRAIDVAVAIIIDAVGALLGGTQPCTIGVTGVDRPIAIINPAVATRSFWSETGHRTAHHTNDLGPGE